MISSCHKDGRRATHHSCNCDTPEDKPKHDAHDVEDKNGFPSYLRVREHEEAHSDRDEKSREDSFDNYEINGTIKLSLECGWQGQGREVNAGYSGSGEHAVSRYRVQEEG